jgi:hypothetical protein
MYYLCNRLTVYDYIIITSSHILGGYDSDVEREKSMDYISMIYAAPIRDAAVAPKDVVKPHQQETKEERGGASGRGKVSRALQSSLNVVTSEDNAQVNVSTNVLVLSPPPPPPPPGSRFERENRHQVLIP